MANPISEQTKSEASNSASGIKKPGQTKEQTKLISQGIEKGIALYKKQQKAKSREQDKQRKQVLKDKQKMQNDIVEAEPDPVKTNRYVMIVPWVLLVASWVGFIVLEMQKVQ